MLSTLTALLIYQDINPQQIPLESRFEYVAPLNLQPVKVHHYLAKYGIAQSTAAQKNLQSRILWVDATANLGRVNTQEKIAQLCKKIADTGFNTIVFDVKPINGYTMYPSQFSEQITSWRDSTMTAGFDPLEHFITESHKNNLSLFVSLNAFSEGHSYGKRDFGKPDNQFFKPGWGYDHPNLQTTRIVPVPTLNNALISPELNVAKPNSPFTIFSDASKAPQNGYFVTLEGTGTVRYSGTSRPEALNGLAMIFTQDPKHADFLSKYRVGSKLVIESQLNLSRAAENQNQIPLMMNPHSTTIQQRTFDFVKEIASKYNIDGLLYDDRLRFGDLNSDFSDETRAVFEKAIGKKVAAWPQDILTYSFTPSLTPRLQPGSLYDAWLLFRAQTLTNWVTQVNQILKKHKPNALFGVYAGSWYGDYQKYGNNYASEDTNAGFPFLTSNYRRTGFASQLDLLITGCYYPNGTVLEAIQAGAAPGRTVEAGGILTNRIVRDQSWAVAGIMVADFYNNPEKIESALQAATATTQGVMVFDLSHNFDDFQPTFARAFKNSVRAPYQVPGLLNQVRKQRSDFDKRGIKEPPFPMFEGAPGTGF